MVLVVSLLLFLITFGTYLYIEVTYNKYKKEKLKSNLSGFEVSRKIIDNYDLNNVYITETNEYLFSNYDSNRKVVRLVKSIFNSESLTSCGISSIVSGYAILDKKEDKIYNIRKLVTPFINIFLLTSYLIIIIGLLFGHNNTLLAGVTIDYLILVFYLFTYSVEKSSYKIVKKELINNKIVNKKEFEKVDKIMKATCLSNIASIIFPIVELIKKIIEFGKSN